MREATLSVDDLERESASSAEIANSIRLAMHENVKQSMRAAAFAAGYDAAEVDAVIHEMMDGPSGVMLLRGASFRP